MTEQEYIDVSDLTNVRAMRAILHDIVAENSSVIPQEEYQTVGKLLSRWAEKLHERIHVSEKEH